VEAVNQALLIGVGVIFVLTATFLLAFDSIMSGQSADALRIGSIAPQDFRAPFSLTYDSEVLTARARQAAADSITPFYDSPDPNIARQQISLVRQILDYVENVRSDPFGSAAQKTADLNAITALTLDETIIRAILDMDDVTWQAVDAEIVLVLERVMRESIRDIDLPLVIDQLPTQVCVLRSQRRRLWLQSFRICSARIDWLILLRPRQRARRQLPIRPLNAALLNAVKRSSALARALKRSITKRFRSLVC
jgi:hypothetical protein